MNGPDLRISLRGFAENPVMTASGHVWGRESSEFYDNSRLVRSLRRVWAAESLGRQPTPRIAET